MRCALAARIAPVGLVVICAGLNTVATEDVIAGAESVPSQSRSGRHTESAASHGVGEHGLAHGALNWLHAVQHVASDDALAGIHL